MEKKIIINIGRQFGGGGLAVAGELGKKLGIPVYDRELIHKAAQDSGFSAEFFMHADERKSIFSLTTLFSSSTDNCMSDSGLFEIQCSTIQKIAQQGSAIIVGRCADYVLREHDCRLNIFLTSPLSVRVDRISERHNLSREKAEALILQKDKAREEYYNYFTFGNWGVASTYDLCIDSSILGTEGTADMIIDFAKRSGLL